MALRTIRQAHMVKGTRVLLRADFDVAVAGRRVKDDFRIREAIPSIQYILARGGLVRIIAHLKRPHGKVVPALSLHPVAAHLQKLLKRRVVLVNNPLDKKLCRAYRDAPEILLFENIRFWPGEEQNSALFASRLAAWGDCYVNDAFANSHRRHASMVAITHLLPSYAGIHLAEEIAALRKVVHSPKRPVVLVLGGAKLETKLPLVEQFLKKGSEVCVGGALANSLLCRKGIDVGRSFVDREMLGRIHPRILSAKKLFLPVDAVVAEYKDDAPMIRPVVAVGADHSIFDIGPKTERLFLDTMRRAKTILWNGPLGLIEVPHFARGTIRVARGLKRIRAFKVLGGGDLIACVREKGLLHGVAHVSTGGGAMLEFLAGKMLPAIKALEC